MDIERVRRFLARGRASLRFADHAVIEARKDGLTEEDLEDTVFRGTSIEDYGMRTLLLSFPKDDKLPCHVG